MTKRNIIISLLAVFTCLYVSAGKTQRVVSPDGNIVLSFETTKEGKIFYSVTRKGETILSPSRLGLQLKDAPDMAAGFSVADVRRDSFTETWKPVWGDRKSVV